MVVNLTSKVRAAALLTHNQNALKLVNSVVILSEAKDLFPLRVAFLWNKVLLFAQDDRGEKEELLNFKNGIFFSIEF